MVGVKRRNNASSVRDAAPLPDVSGPQGRDSRVVFESDTKTIIRSKAWEETLHTTDLKNPFYIMFFVASWLFTLLMWWQRGLRAGIITFVLVTLLNVVGVALGPRNPFLKAVRYVERRFNKYTH